MINEWRNLKEPKYTEYIALRDLYEQKMGKLLYSGIEVKVFKEIDVKVATAVILSSIRWLYDAYANSDSSMNPIELERQIVALVFGGIIK